MSHPIAHKTSFPLRWGNIITYSVLHLGCMAAPFYFSWSGLVVCVVGWVVIGMGITLGWHRLLTHRSFQTYPLVKYLVTFLGYFSWENGLIEWVGTHRLHHTKTDTAGDPHTPKDGWWWSHMGWVLVRPSYDFHTYSPDLSADRLLRAMDRIHWMYPWALCGLLYEVGESTGSGGLSWFLWGGCVRGVLVLHATFLVNSATHTWGYRNFSTPDDSQNLWWVGVLSLGEGWHNNHHAQPRSAAHGMRWWEVDVTYAVIKLMEKLGLAWDVVEPRLEGLPASRGSKQSGSQKGISYEGHF